MKCICCERNIIKPGDNTWLPRGFGTQSNVGTEEDYIWNTRQYGSDENRQYEKAENRMWNDGVVANISAGYGSTLDGNMYLIAICDECTKKKHQEGIIAYAGDYMISDVDYNNEMVEESKKLWRRDQNLDRLSLGGEEDNTL